MPRCPARATDDGQGLMKRCILRLLSEWGYPLSGIDYVVLAALRLVEAIDETAEQAQARGFELLPGNGLAHLLTARRASMLTKMSLLAGGNKPIRGAGEDEACEEDFVLQQYMQAVHRVGGRDFYLPEHVRACALMYILHNYQSVNQ